MFGTVLAAIKARKEDNPYLYDIFCDISAISDYILISDENRILSKSEQFMLMDKFDATVVNEPISNLDYSSYKPDWILNCYSDERPAHKANYLYISLCMNPYVNVWKSTCLFLWESEEYYRTDGRWTEFEFPILYRYCPEVNYKWRGALMPTNQPGPKENSLLPFYSYRFIDNQARETEYQEQIEQWDKLLDSTKAFYNSLLDPIVTIQKAVN